MRGRTVALVVLLALSLLGVSLTAAEAQPARRVPTLGVLSGGFPPSEAQRRQSPFWQAMHELSWIEGQTITVERRFAEGHNERLRGLVTELVQLPVDVILAIGPQEARAARAVSDTIPIVFTTAGDILCFGRGPVDDSQVSNTREGHCHGNRSPDTPSPDQQHPCVGV